MHHRRLSLVYPAAVGLMIMSGQAFGQTQAFQPTYEEGVARPGQDYRSFHPIGPSALYCQQACVTDAQCRAWTYEPPDVRSDKQPMCWLKNRVPPAIKAQGVSGIVRPDGGDVAAAGTGRAGNPASVPAPSVAQAAPAPGLAQAAPAAQGKRLSCTVASGRDDRCTSHRQLDRQGREWPVSINVIAPPARGKITTKIVQETVNNGRQVRATEIDYRSNPGFVGQDSFTYQRHSDDPSDQLNGTYTMIVTVK